MFYLHQIVLSINPFARSAYEDARDLIQEIPEIATTDLIWIGVIIVLLGVIVGLAFKIASELIKFVCIVVVGVLVAAILFGIDPLNIMPHVNEILESR